MGFFQAAHRWGEPKSPPTSLTKICHTYPIMMKLGSYNLPKKIQKMYESRDTSLEFCWHQKFFTGNQQTLKYQGGVRSYVCRSYRGKTSRGPFYPPPQAWIGIQLSVKRKNFGQFKKLWRKKITFRKIFSSM